MTWIQWTAALAAAGFAFLMAFQLLLAWGAPLGAAAWGGRYRRLPPKLRLASLGAIGVLALAALAALETAGVVAVLRRPWLVRGLTWAFAAFFALNAVGNLVSKSALEKRWMTPTALLLSLCCLLVAAFAPR